LAATAVSLLGAGNPYWEMRQVHNQARAELGPANILFLGDSITDLLETGAGRPLWNQYFVPLGAADFAVGGATTSHVLWQIETGQVAAVTPHVVVLLIGSNNLGTGQSPADTAAGITEVVAQLRAQLPRARVVLLGILPRGRRRTEPLRAAIADVNQRIAPLGDGRQVRYLDIGPLFVEPDGSIAPQVMPDFVHPSVYGYGIYTVAIWPTLLAALQDSPSR
jgi:lysophospholipase L1-like esterase